MSPSNKENIENLLAHTDKLISIRMKQFNPPKFVNSENKYNYPLDFKSNIDEIGKIYSLFYSHPCMFYKYIDSMMISEFEKLFDGLKPLFSELLIPNPKCQNEDNMVFLGFFKIVVDQDLKNVKNNIDKLYIEKASFAKILIDCYFFNNYGRSILLDLFKKSFLDLFTLCKVYSSKLQKSGLKGNAYSSFNNLKTFKSLLNFMDGTEKNDTGDRDNITIELINETINIAKGIVIDLQQNFDVIPTHVSYCITYIKK